MSDTVDRDFKASLVEGIRHVARSVQMGAEGMAHGKHTGAPFGGDLATSYDKAHIDRLVNGGLPNPDAEITDVPVSDVTTQQQKCLRGEHEGVQNVRSEQIENLVEIRSSCGCVTMAFEGAPVFFPCDEHEKA